MKVNTIPIPTDSQLELLRAISENEVFYNEHKNPRVTGVEVPRGRVFAGLRARGLITIRSNGRVVLSAKGKALMASL